MAQKDKERWNEKYQDNKIPNRPIELIVKYSGLASGTQALDIACGMGRHSKYLASKGFNVDALDISDVAINSLKDEPRIHAREVDFDTYILQKNRYDLIVCTYFLERKLFPQMIEALKPKGIILYETLLYDDKNERKPSNSAFLLDKKELNNYFSKECEILHYDEWHDIDYQGAKTMKASMVAKKR